MILTKIIPSYPYVEYNDDEDIVAFFNTFNSLAQGGYMDWFVSIGLPVYVGFRIVGDLLDWVAFGLYGQSRPVLPFANDVVSVIAIPNVPVPNEAVPNDDGTGAFFGGGRIGLDFVIGISPIGGGTTPNSSSAFYTNDDVFKRCLTWNLFKGDGKTFNIRWLKRRVKRFLDGPNGVDPGIDETYDISVAFGAGNLVNIILIGAPPTLGETSVPNGFVPNELTPNDEVLIYSTDRGRLLRAAIETGALQLPFQYRYAVYG